MKNFWNNPENNPLKVIVLAAIVIVGGAFVYSHFVNPLGGRASLLGYGYGYTIKPPTVTTNAPTSIGATGAILSGSITATGGAVATSYGFEHGLTTAYGTIAGGVTGSYGIGTYTFGTTGSLAACTVYHYRFYARNSAGTSYGADQAFTTLGCPTYLSETNAYLAAEAAGGATFTTLQKDAIDRWFRDMRGEANPSYPTSNIFGKIKVAYLSLAGLYGADRVNAITPGTLNYTDTGSPAYSTATRNVKYNGTSQYSDTGFTPNGAVSFTASNFTGFGIHRADTASGGTTNGQVGETGGGNSFMNLATGYKTIVNGAKTAYNQADTRAINGLWFTGWSNATTLNTYYNGVKIKTVTTSFNNTPTRSLDIGAIHAAVPVYPSHTSMFDFHIEVFGAWSDAEAKLIYDATKALKTAFGVTWL